MRMKRTENVQKNHKLERHETPVLTPMSNNPAPGHVAGIGRMPGIRRTVRPFEVKAQERREQMYIFRALSGVPRGTSVLNWPCGCNRLLPFLKKLGYHVTSADSSSDAVGRIRLYGGLLGEDCLDEKDDFHVVNIFRTGFKDDRFGAAVVNQLFCLPASQIRQLVLMELRRICYGPIVVSSFCNTMIYKNPFCWKLKPYEHETKHRFGLNRRAFAEEVSKSGLTVEKWVPRLGFRKRQLFAVLVRDKDYEGFTSTTKS
jgi:SAM-dependent methyltransferase